MDDVSKLRKWFSSFLSETIDYFLSYLHLFFVGGSGIIECQLFIITFIIFPRYSLFIDK